jgi:outer membrane immunogenic protein
MLRRVILAGLSSVALIVPGFGGPVFATDMPVNKAPAYAPVPYYNWTGFYVGGHVGWGAVGENQTAISSTAGIIIIPPGTVINTDSSSFLGGGQIGYNQQTGNWVFGAEGDFSWTNAKASATIAGTLVANSFRTQNANTDWYATLTGRIGYAWDNWLLYVKGGAAWMNVNYNNNVTVVPTIFNFPGSTDTRLGWTIGVGIEQALWNNWSWKLEYNYMDFGTRRYAFLDTTGTITTMFDINTKVNAVKVGLNYRWGGPVIAKY